MALVFQEYSRSLMPWTIGAEQRPAAAAAQEAVARASGTALVEEAIESVGLTRFMDHYPWQLSGGMQQRVAIARALAYQPSVLLMDEPFASVDAQTRGDLEDLVLRLRDEYGITILFVTHDIDESVYLADRVIVLTHSPTEVKEIVPVELPRPRDQIATKELAGVRTSAGARLPADQAGAAHRRRGRSRRRDVRKSETRVWQLEHSSSIITAAGLTLIEERMTMTCMAEGEGHRRARRLADRDDRRCARGADGLRGHGGKLDQARRS